MASANHRCRVIQNWSLDRLSAPGLSTVDTSKSAPYVCAPAPQSRQDLMKPQLFWLETVELAAWDGITSTPCAGSCRLLAKGAEICDAGFGRPWDGITSTPCAGSCPLLVNGANILDHCGAALKIMEGIMQ